MPDGDPQLAAHVLRVALTEPAARQKWQQFVTRRRESDINAAAVATVIALYLWDSGERPESQTTLARQLKDRVTRALAGKGISEETLRWFCEAFDFDENTSAHLRLAINPSADADWW